MFPVNTKEAENNSRLNNKNNCLLEKNKINEGTFIELALYYMIE